MQARHAAQAGQHARGGHHRGVRATSRDTHGDHAHELDLAQGPIVSGTTRDGTAAGGSLVAVLPTPYIFDVEWIEFRSNFVVSAGYPAPVYVLSLPSRGPPTLS
jgi:hypothetical protein